MRVGGYGKMYTSIDGRTRVEREQNRLFKSHQIMLCSYYRSTISVAAWLLHRSHSIIPPYVFDGNRTTCIRGIRILKQNRV